MHLPGVKTQNFILLRRRTVGEGSLSLRTPLDSDWSCVQQSASPPSQQTS